MLRKSAAHQKKVDSAVRILQTTTGVKVPGAMILTGFSKSDSASKIVHQQVQHCLAQNGGANKNRRKVIFVGIEDDSASLSDLTSENNELLPITMMTTTALSSSIPTNPKPKRKQIRPPASAFQQRRVENLVSKHCFQATQDLT
jgi:hypothetical protein